jgi:hypothetical protein
MASILSALWIIFQTVQGALRRVFWDRHASAKVKVKAESQSRWDELPKDIQENVMVLRTRLHFADCLQEFKTVGPSDKRAAVIHSIMKKCNKWHKLYLAEDAYEKRPGQFEEFVQGEIQALCEFSVDYDLFFKAMFDRATTFRELYFMDYKVMYTSIETALCNRRCSCIYATMNGVPLDQRECRFSTCHATSRGMYTLEMLEDIRYNMDKGYDCDYETDDEDM